MNNYDNFVKTVCRNKVIWTLDQESAPAVLADHKGRKYFLFWTTKELAEMSVKGEFRDYSPMSVSIYEFVAKVLPIFIKNNDKVTLHLQKKDRVDMNPGDLKADLESEITENE